MTLTHSIRRLLDQIRNRDEHGATAVEYGLMVAMIAIVIVGAVTLFGSSVVALYSIPAGIFSRG
jgi:pilus assembly protein Flp/PilA